MNQFPAAKEYPIRTLWIFLENSQRYSPLKCTIGVANLPPVSTTLAVLVVNFSAHVVVPVVHLDLQIFPRIFEKILNDPNAIIRGLWEDDSREKKQKQKISWHCPFNASDTYLPASASLRAMTTPALPAPTTI